MRIKKFEKQQRIMLTIEEAKQIKQAFDDYVDLCENCGYGEITDKTDKLINQLDEIIMKAESM